MKKAILFSIIGVALMSLGFAATTFASHDYYDPCGYYGCFEPIMDPESGFLITSINDNYNYSDNNNQNTNNISIGGSFGGGYYGGDYYDLPQCDDGYDNDGDGRVDYPFDSGCSSYNDDSERSSSNNNDRECDDGYDNDRDGDYDYPEDRGCSSYSDDSEDSDDNDNDEPQCDDNRDNDHDGDYDYPEDRGCSSRNDDSENSDDNDNDDEPEVTTRSASDIKETSAVLNGRVDGNGLSTRVWFEYSDDRDDVDNDEETSEDSVGSGTTSFNERITGLRRNTTYYFRAVAENNDGEDRGSIMSFRTDDDNDDEPECDDNRDNDRDGDEDYPDDRGCSSRNDDSEDSDDRDHDDDRNLPPFYTSIPATSVIAGQLYSYNADAVSPNGRSITYSLTTRPSGMTINQFTGQVLWTTSPVQAGTSHVARVVAEDSNGNTATQTFTILVRAQTVINPPFNPPVNPPAAELRVRNVQVKEVSGEVIVSFDTSIDARGSVRYGEASEIDKTDNFTYPFGQVSESGQGTEHEVNLGSLMPNQLYYIRAFATAGSRSAFSSEFAFTRQVVEDGSMVEVAGEATCFDGIDNDRDGVADSADSDCEADVIGGQTTGTFASAMESFGAFLISPWFLLLVIIVLVIYIIITRRVEEDAIVHGPIEIKS